MPISKLIKQSLGESTDVQGALGDSKIDKLIKAAQWENPICHGTITPHEHQTPDFCRFMNVKDNPSHDSLYSLFHKAPLRERLLAALKAALKKKKAKSKKKKAA